MKFFKHIAAIAVVVLIALTSCKKTNDFGGPASINGVVTLNGTAVSNAVVYLTLNATEASTVHDATTITDATGTYHFKGLLRGDYFVNCEYTNANGIKFVSGGGKVTIGDKKGEVQADLTLQ